MAWHSMKHPAAGSPSTQLSMDPVPRDRKRLASDASLFKPKGANSKLAPVRTIRRGQSKRLGDGSASEGGAAAE